MRTLECVDNTPKCNGNLDRSVAKPMSSLIKTLKKNLQKSNRNADISGLNFGYSYSSSNANNVMSSMWQSFFGSTHNLGTDFQLNVVLGNEVVPAVGASCTCTGKGRKQRCGYYYKLLNSRKAKLMRKFPKWNHINKAAGLLDSFNEVVRS